MTPLAPGLHYDVPEDVYHADRLCAVPTLSRAIAQRLLTRSPAHAWHAHPRLNPRFTPEPPSDAFEFGRAVSGDCIRDWTADLERLRREMQEAA